jgi:dihydrofolate synthase/folylpolyglutamate synthase
MNSDRLTTCTETLDWLHSLLRFGQKPGLERMQWMLEQLDHPERRIPFVHVAGTNGKGSTCAFLTRVLREAGYSVGTFTSPYVTGFRERIRYNEEPISEEDLVAVAQQIKPLAERCAEESGFGSPTEFEVITMMAILYFATVKRPAVVVWETGLGGRHDSTNVVFPLVSVITNIGTDHADVLGSTLNKIAWEKAGIIKPGVPVVLGEMSPEAAAVMVEEAQRKKATVYAFGFDFHGEADPAQTELGRQIFTYRSIFRRHPATYEISLNGEYQVKNAAVALMTIDLLKEFYAFLVEPEEMERGMKGAAWPGRLEVLVREPLILMDGAHNAEGVEAVAKSLHRYLPQGAQLHLLFGALADKPLQEMARRWMKHAPETASVTLTTFDFSRAASLDRMKAEWLEAGTPADVIRETEDWHGFVNGWMNDPSRQGDVLLILGSLYFIAQVRTAIPPVNG